MQNFSISGVVDVGGVLGGDDDVDDAGRLAIDVFDGDLRLRVRAQPLGELAGSCGSGSARGRGGGRT